MAVHENASCCSLFSPLPMLAGCSESARQGPAEIPIRYGIRSGRPGGSAVPPVFPARLCGHPGPCVAAPGACGPAPARFPPANAKRQRRRHTRTLAVRMATWGYVRPEKRKGRLFSGPSRPRAMTGCTAELGRTGDRGGTLRVPLISPGSASMHQVLCIAVIIGAPSSSSRPPRLGRFPRPRCKGSAQPTRRASNHSPGKRRLGGRQEEIADALPYSTLN